MPPGFTPASRRDRIAPGRAVVALVGGEPVALYEVGGRVLAIDDRCARCGGSLAEGRQDQRVVECARCGWSYELDTGAVVGLAALRLDRYDVRIRDSEVFVAPHPTGSA
ncbi:MAG TPA: nitrite reductase (NAD(P)H) small subunit [Casimicrobiaceae bacterium]|nr:nitrite reductase (NAD(P)H) small subunit [Casimicrobiaceae bacterium]